MFEYPVVYSTSIVDDTKVVDDTDVQKGKQEKEPLASTSCEPPDTTDPKMSGLNRSTSQENVEKEKSG